MISPNKGDSISEEYQERDKKFTQDGGLSSTRSILLDIPTSPKGKNEKYRRGTTLAKGSAPIIPLRERFRTGSVRDLFPKEKKEFNFDKYKEMQKKDTSGTNVLKSMKTLHDSTFAQQDKTKQKMVGNPAADLLMKFILERTVKASFISDSTTEKQERDEQANEELDKNSKKISKFQENLESLTENDRYDLAALIFRCAIFSRKLRYHFPSEFVKKAYRFYGNPVWSSFLVYLIWIYMFLSFFEPANKQSTPYNPHSATFFILLFVELIILSSLFINLSLEIILRWTDIEGAKVIQFVKNKKFMIGACIDILLLIDMIYFYASYSNGVTIYRFARMLRPLKLLSLSDQLRRWFRSLIQTWDHVLDIIILFSFTVIIFAVLGLKLIGSEGNRDLVTDENDFSNFGKAILSLYFLITMSNYPNVLVPYCTESNYYFLYFLPFMYIILLFFIPIPVAVIFTKFRECRTQLLISDMMREKEALYGVHCCIDIDKSHSIDRHQWERLWETIYPNKFEKEEDQTNSKGVMVKLDTIFKQFDIDDSGGLDIDEFFDACELVLCMPDIQRAYVCEPSCWKTFRNFMNTKLHFRAMVTSRYFEIFILVVLAVNLVVILMAEFATDPDMKKTCEDIDYYILFIYVFEVIVKLVALGFTEYFADPWNKFDFGLVSISLIIQSTISFMKLAKYPKGLRALRTTSQARKSRSLRVLKELKLKKDSKCGICLAIFLIPFLRIKSMLYKIYMNILTINSMVSIMIITFYIYAIMGMQIYYTREDKEIRNKEFASSFYGNFDSFDGALIALFQVVTQSGWHAMTLHYALNFNYVGTLFFFGTFHMVVVIIILNLISGLIWEVCSGTKDKIINEQLEGGVEDQEDIQDKGEVHKIHNHKSETLTADSSGALNKFDESKGKLSKMSQFAQIAEESDQEHNNSNGSIISSSYDSEMPSSKKGNSFQKGKNNDRGSFLPGAGTLTPDTTTRNLQEIAQKSGIEYSAKLILREVLLGDKVQEVKKKEREKIEKEFDGGKERFNNATSVVTDQVRIKTLVQNTLFSFLKNMRKVGTYTECVKVINQALWRCNKIFGRGYVFLMVNEIEVKVEKEILLKEFTPFTEAGLEAVEISEILHDIFEYSSQSSFSICPIYAKKAKNYFTIKNDEFYRKENLFRTFSEIGMRLKAESILTLEKESQFGITWDLYGESIKLCEETFETSYDYDEKVDILSHLNTSKRLIWGATKKKKGGHAPGKKGINYEEEKSMKSLNRSMQPEQIKGDVPLRQTTLKYLFANNPQFINNRDIEDEHLLVKKIHLLCIRGRTAYTTTENLIQEVKEEIITNTLLDLRDMLMSSLYNKIIPMLGELYKELEAQHIYSISVARSQKRTGSVIPFDILTEIKAEDENLSYFLEEKEFFTEEPEINSPDFNSKMNIGFFPKEDRHETQ